MKSFILYIIPSVGILLPLLPCISAAQTIVSDPLLDYYQSAPPSIASPVEVIKCSLTGDHRPSFLITDASQSGYRHFSGGDWTFYYPIKGGKYRKTDSGYSGDTPNYIGYVKEIKSYGIVSETIARHSSEDSTISVDYINNGDLKDVTLMSGTGEIEDKFPKYFNPNQTVPSESYTLDALQKMYPNAKLDTGLVDDPLRDYVERGCYLTHPPHDPKSIKVYVISANFTDDKRESIFITDESSEYTKDAGRLEWQFYRPSGDNKYSCAADFFTGVDQDHDLDVGITAPLTGPAYLGYIDEIKGYGAIFIDKEDNWLVIQYANDELIRTNVVSGADKEAYTKYISSPKTFEVGVYDLPQLLKKYKNGK